MIKINEHILKVKAGLNYVKFNSKNLNNGSNHEVPALISEISTELEKTNSHQEALDVLFKNVKKGRLELKNSVLFKHGDFIIQNVFKNFGSIYEQNLKKVNNLGLSIVPDYIKSIIKDNDMFIISRIKGTKSGDLLPYAKAKDKVSRENKLLAFSDLQKLTKAGLTDDRVSRSSEMWYVTPDDNKIMIPSFEMLRNLNKGENKKVLEQYHKIIFN